MTWKEVSATPHDAELSEARRLAVVEVARIFNVPPPMLAALEDATYSNIEAQVRMFATGTIRPWATAWEQAVRRDLLSEESARTHQVMFDLDHLLRGDLLTRMQAWRIAREIGAVNANENPRGRGMGSENRPRRRRLLRAREHEPGAGRRAEGLTPCCG